MLGIAGFLIIPAVILGLVSAVTSLWLVVIAFRKHVLWGLASLFVPFAVLAFAIKHWDETRKPFLISLGSGVVSTVLAFVALGMGAVGLGQRMEAEMAAQAEAAVTAAEAENAPASEAPAPGVAPDSRSAEATHEGSDASPSPMDILEGFAPTIDAEVAGASDRDRLAYDPAKVTSDGFAPISLSEATKAVGRPVRVVGRDGRRHYGELVAANTGGLKLQRWLSGSEVIYEMRTGEIDSVLVDVRP